MARSRERRWLLLIHNIPPKPDYLRVKVWRRLQKIGAVPIKNSVYVLPYGDQALEDFQWTVREVVESGGEASVCEAGFVEGLTDDEVEALFRAARDADYKATAVEARELVRRLAPGRGSGRDGKGQFASAVARLRRRLSEIVAIDFFDSLERQGAEGLVAGLEARLRSEADHSASSTSLRVKDASGRTWVTRKGLHIDRMASAWLIRRFIDREAKFKFVPARGYRPRDGEIRFDMFEAEFTHAGDRCTFEVLAARTGLDGKALRAIAEIVHDIDLKDGKFRRPEAAGIERLITGIGIAHKDDETRLARGCAVFDDLHRAFARGGR